MKGRAAAGFGLVEVLLALVLLSLALVPLLVMSSGSRREVQDSERSLALLQQVWEPIPLTTDSFEGDRTAAIFLCRSRTPSSGLCH